METLDRLIPRPPQRSRSEALLIAEAKRIFLPLFPGFRALHAYRPTAHTCYIPFVWIDGETPKQGVLGWRFEPPHLRSPLRPSYMSPTDCPDWISFAFLEYQPEFAAFEPILTLAFLEELNDTHSHTPAVTNEQESMRVSD